MEHNIVFAGDFASVYEFQKELAHTMVETSMHQPMANAVTSDYLKNSIRRTEVQANPRSSRVCAYISLSIFATQKK